MPVALRQKRWDSFSIQAEKHLKFLASISEVGSQGQVNFVWLSVPLGLKLILTYSTLFLCDPFYRSQCNFTSLQLRRVVSGLRSEDVNYAQRAFDVYFA